MKIIQYLFVICCLCATVGSAYSQNDEKYYYKLGKKYLFTKDYKTASKHFNKCMSVAEKNKSENPNYYYYPMLMYYYGVGKIKEMKKVTELITELVPASPDVPSNPGSAKQRAFEKDMDAYGVEIDKSDYIFLRHYIHFKANEMDVVETFDRMEFAVRYHGNKSVIPLQASFDFMKAVYMKAYEEHADPETSAAPFKVRLCYMFKKAVKDGNVQAKKVVAANCQ